ncbi:hypothetical protein [Herbidospora cretacea]|uniref:hypothetical protein n=1 Tax=Herbidospora cretacea TaxID=28444 RepID=UPI001E46260B|nr:hypothetical protein [Herbidospora cretacea]
MDRAGARRRPPLRNEVTFVSLWNLAGHHPTGDLAALTIPVHAILATDDDHPGPGRGDRPRNPRPGGHGPARCAARRRRR